MAAALFAAGCVNRPAAAPAEEPAAAETPSPAPTRAPTPAPTPEPTPEPTPAEPRPFAEEHGFTFTEEPAPMDAPGIVICTIEKTEVTEKRVGITGVDVTLAPAEEEGFVTYTVVLTAEARLDLNYPEPEDNYWYVKFQNYEPYDAYTGRKLDAGRVNTEGDGTVDGEPRTTELSYEGNTWAVTAQTSLTADWDDRVTDAEDGSRRVQSWLRAVTTWQITVPEDYDGLIFGMDLAEEPENDFDTRDEDPAPAWWTGDSAAWAFFRPADLTE